MVLDRRPSRLAYRARRSPSGTVTEWTARPSALAAPESVDALDFARTLLGSEDEAVA